MTENTQAPERLTPEARLTIVEDAIDRRLAALGDESEFLAPLAGDDLEALLKARNMLAGAVRMSSEADARVVELESALASLAVLRDDWHRATDALTPGDRAAVAEILNSRGLLEPLKRLAGEDA